MNVIKPNHKYLSKVSRNLNQETTSAMAKTSAKTSIIETNTTTTNPTNLLNVAEMLLHGVADEEILDNWLRSIDCHEFVDKFLEAGYTMAILPRVTPQDLTAIGIREPIKRTKILREIKKLNLQDCTPNHRPNELRKLLELLNLDRTNYYEQLCEQQIDTVEKLCQLTWEDFEELGITKLGHQKILQLAIERLKALGDDNRPSQSVYGSNLKKSHRDLDNDLDNNTARPTATLDGKSRTKNLLPEPIYDTNLSQILLMTSSTDNHCLNGPMIGKQSSIGEVSSTGSGSLNSNYSSGSYTCGQQQQICHNAHQQQSIHSHPLPPASHYQQPSSTAIRTLPVASSLSIYHCPQALQNGLDVAKSSSTSKNEHPESSRLYSTTGTVNNHADNERTSTPSSYSRPQQNAKSDSVDGVAVSSVYKQADELRLGCNDSTPPRQDGDTSATPRTPFGAFVNNLPSHHRHTLQHSSIYATLTRKPNSVAGDRSKRVPPPVPVRRESLRSSSMDHYSKQSHMSTESLADDLSAMSVTGVCNDNEADVRGWSRVGSKHSIAARGSVMSVGNLIRRSGAQTLRFDKNRSLNNFGYLSTLRARYWSSRKNSNIETTAFVPSYGQAQQSGAPTDNGIYNCDTNQQSNHRNVLYSSAHTFGPVQQQPSSDYFTRISDATRDSQTLDRAHTEFSHHLTSNRSSVPIFQSPEESLNSPSDSVGRPRDWIAGKCTSSDSASDTRSLSSFVVREKNRAPVTGIWSTTGSMDQANSAHLIAKDETTSQSTSSSETLHQSASFGSTDQASLNNLISPTNQRDANSSSRTGSASTLQNNYIHSVRSMNASSSNSTITSSNSSDNNHANSLQMPSGSRRDVGESSARESNGLVPAAPDVAGAQQCNATTGEDIEFPPPPPPLAMFEYAGGDNDVAVLDSDLSGLNGCTSSSGNGRLAVGS